MAHFVVIMRGEQMSDYTAKIPVVVSAVFSPNPANMNTSTLLSVQVTEETVVLEPTWFYSDEIYSGEV